jgi:TolA-binding protein
MVNRTLGLCLIVSSVWIIGSVRCANAAGPTEAQMLRRIMHEVDELQADKQQDEKKIQNLEQKVDQIQSQNKQLKEANQKLQTDTGTKIEALQTKVDAPIASSEFGNAFDRYLGSHTFSITGAVGGNFVYNQQSAALDSLHHASRNSFFVDWS